LQFIIYNVKPIYPKDKLFILKDMSICMQHHVLNIDYYNIMTKSIEMPQQEWISTMLACSCRISDDNNRFV